jgi:hypothetical protein
MESVGEDTYSTGSAKPCSELGWSLQGHSKVCTHTPKVDDMCVSEVSADEATSMCQSLGGRLCSSQELSDPHWTEESNDCSSEERVWTSSACAFGTEVITQAGFHNYLNSRPKRCTDMASFAATVRCCADEFEPTGFEFPSISSVVAPMAGKSELTCDKMPGFAIPPMSRNKNVCSTGYTSGPISKQCSGAVSFAQAQGICTRLGARICTADELSKDVAVGTGCDLEAQRVWTSTECPFPGQVLTQAASKEGLDAAPQLCSSQEQDLMPVLCCGDYEGFTNLVMDVFRNSASLSWEWPAYRNAEVSVRKVGRRSKWVSKGQAVSGESFDIEGLMASTPYMVRIVPLSGSRKVFTQAVINRMTTKP